MVILQESSVTSSLRIKSNENRLEIGDWDLDGTPGKKCSLLCLLNSLSRACILCMNFRGVLYSFATVVVSE